MWAVFWLIILIVLLGLVFGGYRKGTPVKNPGSVRLGGVSDSVLWYSPTR